jgi:type IV pilus assembly protein PilB
MLRLNDALRQSMRSENHNDQMRILARNRGIKFMQEYALDLVRDSLTTFEEVQRVVAFNQTPSEACESCARELSPTFAFCPFCGLKRHSWHLQMPAHRASSKREAVNE